MSSTIDQSDAARFQQASRLVVKVGSGVLAPAGTLDPRAVGRIARQLSRLASNGIEPILVSSGAVACGFRSLGLSRMPRSIVKKQAAAAIGQQALMHAYTKAFARTGLSVGQVLLTADDLQNRERFLNARHTLMELIACGVIPIINENDSVSYEEIRVGDNDRLSALVATLVDADALVILTTVPGIRRHAGRGRVIETVDDADALDEHIGSESSATGVGGMATKVDAAKLATHAGIPCVVADGRKADILDAILAGDRVGTSFRPRARADASRKKWIGYASRVRGAVIIDDGARAALTARGASLLPSGVVAVDGEFDAGATVLIRDAKGNEIARGITSYSAREILALRGCRTSEIVTRLGYNYSDEIVHRDDLLILRNTEHQ